MKQIKYPLPSDGRDIVQCRINYLVAYLLKTWIWKISCRLLFLIKILTFFFAPSLFKLKQFGRVLQVSVNNHSFIPGDFTRSAIAFLPGRQTYDYLSYELLSILCLQQNNTRMFFPPCKNTINCIFAITINQL